MDETSAVTSILKKYRNIIPYFLLWISLITGCATIIRGTSQTITVTTDPPGATIIVNGNDQYISPADIKLSRAEGYTCYYFEIRKEGYIPKRAKVESTIDTGIFSVSNVAAALFPISGFVDSMTGANQPIHYDQKGMHIKLISENVNCVCMHCGKKINNESDKKCDQINCPSCGKPMEKFLGNM